MSSSSLLTNQSGCGPLGLLILAVAKAYGVRKVVMFDIEQSRVDFAVKYGADAGIMSPKREEGVEALTFAQDYAKEVIKKYDLGNGFDVTVEASGAEACTHMALCMLKNGGTCKSPTLEPRTEHVSSTDHTCQRYSSWVGPTPDFSAPIYAHSKRT